MTGGSSPRAHSGVSLLEVLISILIASVGLLAMAGISAAALKQSKFSQSRAGASQLAMEIAERMRATAFVTSDLALYDYQRSMSAQATLEPAPSPLCEAAADNCTRAQMAAADLWQWRAHVRSQLPAGSAVVMPDPTLPGSVDIWVAWRDAAPASAEENVRTGGAKECPLALESTDDLNVRCVHLRARI